MAVWQSAEGKWVLFTSHLPSQASDKAGSSRDPWAGCRSFEPSPGLRLSAEGTDLSKVCTGLILASRQPRCNTSASSVVCLGIILKSKISQKSFKELYWEAFTASEQSAWIWLMCVSFRLTECSQPPNPGDAPTGTASSALSQNINALGLGGLQLLSSFETPARKQAFDLWGFWSCIFLLEYLIW